MPAISLLEARGFTAETSPLPPGGRLGRRLLLLIGDIMHSGTAIRRSTPTPRSAKRCWK